MRDLEEQLAAQPDDVALRLVLADALVQRGDPRGSLIHLQCGLEAATGDDRARLHGEIAELLARVEPREPHVELEWRLGFVRTATVTANALELVPRLLAHPALRLVRELVIAVEREELPALGAAVAARPQPSHVHRIYVGPPAGRWVGRGDASWAHGELRPYDRISHAQLVEVVAAETAEVRNELRIQQIVPLFDRWNYQVELPIRDGALAQVQVICAAFSERVRPLFAIDGGRVRFKQESDQSYAGYGNVYEALVALAPFVEDVRFVVCDWNWTWVDEYEIRGGALVATRGFIDDDERWLARAADRPDDRDLGTFVAHQMLYNQMGPLARLDRQTGREASETAADIRAILDAVADIDDTLPDLWEYRGRLEHSIGNLVASDRAFARHAELAGNAAARFDRALVAFSAGEDGHVRELLAEIPEDDSRRTRSAAQLIAAYLGAGTVDALLATVDVQRQKITQLDEAKRSFVWQMIEPAFPDILRTGRFDDLLAWCETALPATPSAAAYLLCWAETFRLQRRAHRDARRFAHRLYRRAAELDPLAGSVHFCWSRFDAARADKLLEQALVVEPDHLAALAALGVAARKRGDVDRAIELLERHVRRFQSLQSGGSFGRYWDGNLAELAHAYRERATKLLFGVRHAKRRPPGRPSDEALDRTEAALAPALALQDSLAPAHRKAGAGVYQLMAIVEEYRGRHEHALAWADRAVAVNDAAAHVLATRGGCLANVGRLDEAIACCEQALESDAAEWHAHLVIARVLARRDGDRTEIYRRLRRVVALWSGARHELAATPELAVLRGEPAFAELIGQALSRGVLL